MIEGKCKEFAGDLKQLAGELEKESLKNERLDKENFYLKSIAMEESVEVSVGKGNEANLRIEVRKEVEVENLEQVQKYREIISDYRGELEMKTAECVILEEKLAF